jgi:hypothetical protein
MDSQQSRFLSKLKTTVKLGECVLLCDFAKNRTFFQDEAPTYHWNNAYATVLFTTYVKDSISAAVISENLMYFRLHKICYSCSYFPATLIDFLKDNINQPLKKIIYLYDGS